MHRPVPTRQAATHLQLDRWLRQAILVGAVMSLLLPWRSDWLGLTAMWLVGMPLSAWWALHHFRLPQLRRVEAVRRRRPGMQARRRKPIAGKGWLRAA
ncbi:MAG: hypothetical protein QM769_01240 [Pseudoxanthomonas sp.]